MRLAQRLVLITLLVAGMAALFALLNTALTERSTDPAPGTTALRPTAIELLAAAFTAAAPAEALVFRTRPGDHALDPHGPRRAEAHPRTLATFRALRAFAGAPPRVPHGLSADEFRGGLCNTCHERGGYSPRFAAYVPVTPHPELADCLQCHTSDAALVGTPLPDRRADALCRQCHRPERDAAGPVLDWEPAPWPAVLRRPPDGTPPPVPHDLQLRGNCLACHMGPSAVTEIRTAHPERADCLQCHLTQHDDIVRATDPLAAGGAP
jgi:nitrate reductase (cytochrome), electron transfer subunit